MLPGLASAFAGAAAQRAAAGPNTFLSRSFFEPFVGADFRLSGPGPVRSLRLLSVEPGRKPKADSRRGPDVELTCLRFFAPGEILHAGTYTLEHADTGRFDLHLSPGLPGRYIADLAIVPPGYLASIRIPRRMPRKPVEVA